MESNFDPGILKKLRINGTLKMLIVNSPSGYLDLLADLDPDTTLNPENMGTYDFVQVFGTGRTELESLILHLKDAGKYDAVFWACYPKGGGSIPSDLKREIVWAVMELIHLRPVSQVALNATWSALRGRPHEKVKGK